MRTKERKGDHLICLSCGCGEPNERHGDSRHITQDDLQQAAQAAGISPQQAAQNIGQGLQRGGSTGQGPR